MTGTMQLKKKVAGERHLQANQGAVRITAKGRRQVEMKEEMPRSCISNIAKPWLVSTVFFRILVARGSSKWWNARLNSLMTPFPSLLFTSDLGASLASTPSLSNEISGLFFANRSQAGMLGCRSVRTKSTGAAVRALRLLAMPGVGPPAPAQKSTQTEEERDSAPNSRRRMEAQMEAGEAGMMYGIWVFQTRVRASWTRVRRKGWNLRLRC